jgi:hypothetical protein
MLQFFNVIEMLTRLRRDPKGSNGSWRGSPSLESLLSVYFVLQTGTEKTIETEKNYWPPKNK